MEKIMTKVALYLRSSKDRHDVSIDSQRREIQELVKKDGGEIVAEYVDKAISGKTDKRPGFQQMMSDIRANKDHFSKVYLYDTGRFSRRQFITSSYKHELQKAGVELVYLKIPIKGMQPSSSVMAVGVSEIFDNYFSEKSKEDGLRGMRENIINGYRAGGRALFGYKLQYYQTAMNKSGPVLKAKLEPDPDKFELAREYLLGRLRGESRNFLKKKLDLPLSQGQMLYMEKSALAYAGYLIWNRHNERIDGSYVGGERERPEEQWHFVAEAHVPAITEDQARQLMAKIRKRSLGKRCRNSSYILSGLLVCRCGSPMDGDDGYYRCHNRCGASKVKQDRIEKAVIGSAFAEIMTPGVKASVIQRTRDLAENEQSLAAKVKLIKKEIAEITTKQSILTDTLVETEFKRPLLVKIEELEKRRLELEQKLEETQSSRSEELNCNLEMFEKFQEACVNNPLSINSMGLKTLLGSLFQKLKYTEKNLVEAQPM